mgnify:CR=1 FL=1
MTARWVDRADAALVRVLKSDANRAAMGASLCAIAHPSQDRLSGAQQQWLTEVAGHRAAHRITSPEPLGGPVIALDAFASALERQASILRSEELPDLHDGVQDLGYPEPQVDAFGEPDLW